MPDSSCSIICVLRAILALKGVGSARASSKELVCKDWVPPNTAAMASIVVRTILLYGSWSKNWTRWNVTSCSYRNIFFLARFPVNWIFLLGQEPIDADGFLSQTKHRWKSFKSLWKFRINFKHLSKRCSLLINNSRSGFLLANGISFGRFWTK